MPSTFTDAFASSDAITDTFGGEGPITATDVVTDTFTVASLRATFDSEDIVTDGFTGDSGDLATGRYRR